MLLSNSLTDLAARVHAEHQSCETALRSALKHAMTAGDLLLEAKAQVKHGEWLPWLKEQCSMSDRMAQRYIRLAQNRAAIEANASRVSDLSIRGALAMLATKRPIFVTQAEDQLDVCFLGAKVKWHEENRELFHETLSLIERLEAAAANHEHDQSTRERAEEMLGAARDCRERFQAAVDVDGLEDECRAALILARDLAKGLVERTAA
jgi:hypothetical protein